jgi:hypothetical protein
MTILQATRRIWIKARQCLNVYPYNGSAIT